MQDEVNNLKINMAKFEMKIDNISSKLDDHAKQQVLDIGRIEGAINKFFDAADCKYASKDIETQVKEIKDRQTQKDEDEKKKLEQRNYDWVKYLITTIVAILIAIKAK